MVLFFGVQGNSARAKEIAALLGQKMDNLEVQMRKAIARKVVEDFKDPLGPLRAMTEAAYAAPGKVGSLSTFSENHNPQIASSPGNRDGWFCHPMHKCSSYM